MKISPQIPPNITAEQSAVLESLRDSKFYRETFFWIVDKNSKKVPYRQNFAQAKYYMEKSKNDLILKPRKLGFSSEIEGDYLYRCMTLPNQYAVTMSSTHDDTVVHMQRIQRYIETMGSGKVRIEVKLDRESERELRFCETDSYYWTGTAGASTFGRGRDITLLHASEVPHWPDQSVLTSVFEACTPGAARVLESTAKGVGEKFHEMWEEAGDPASGSPWKRHFFAWFEDPANCSEVPPGIKWSSEEIKMQLTYKLSDAQVMWWRLKRNSMADKSLMNQEYPCCAQDAFIASGRHVFSLPNLKVMEDRMKDERGEFLKPLYTGEAVDDKHTSSISLNPDGRLSVWIPPRDRRRYLIAGDVAKGVPGGSFSVASVHDRASWECVAEWRGRIDATKFGNILCDIGYWYNDAVLIPENNNDGKVAIAAIKARGYGHLFQTSDVWGEDETVDYGFPTTEKTKPMIISALRNAIESLSYKENSVVALNELKNSVYDVNGKMVSQIGVKKKDEEKGAHLDCVIARCIAMYALKFLTVDDTYRESARAKRGMVVSSLATSPGGRTGYSGKR